MRLVSRVPIGVRERLVARRTTYMPSTGGTHSIFMTTRSFMSLSIGSSSQAGLSGVDFSQPADAASGTAEIEKMLSTMLSIIERMLAQAIQQQNEIAGIGKTGNSAPPAPAGAGGADAGGGANAGGGADAAGGADPASGADAASGTDATGGAPSIESMLQSILQMLQQMQSSGAQAGGQDTSQMLQMLGEITQMLGQLQQANSAQGGAAAGGAAQGGAATGGDAAGAASGDQNSSIESMMQEILKMLQQMTAQHGQSGHRDGQSSGQHDQVMQMLGEITQMLQQMMPQASSSAGGM
jgi:hypothetical protein